MFTTCKLYNKNEVTVEAVVGLCWNDIAIKNYWSISFTFQLPSTNDELVNNVEITKNGGDLIERITRYFQSQY